MTLDLLHWIEHLSIGIVASVVVLASIALVLSSRRNRHTLPLPPGPKGLPLLGNILDIPLDKPWKVYDSWSKQYGDVMYMSALGHKMLVLNSLSAVNALLVNRAANYSDRPDSPIVDLTGLGWVFLMMRYGYRWREHRREFHRFFAPAQVGHFRPIIEQEVPAYLKQLVSTPQDFRAITHRFFGMVIIRVSYGAKDVDYNNKLVSDADRFAQGFMDAFAPGRLLVGILPSLRHVPSWLPGAGWKRNLQELAILADEIKTKPFEEAKARLESGVQSSDDASLAAMLIADLPDEGAKTYKDKLEMARSIAGMSYLAGIDTTVALGLALFFALATNPAVQRRAQEEIDSVVGIERMPTFDDLNQLLYVQAIVKEVQRWHSVNPLGVPHMSEKDDEYNGYHIPAGTVILPNTWAIMHSSESFEEPFEFKPDRFMKDGKLDSSALDPDVAAFGYGRRICPGRHFSNDALSLMAVSLLACFDIAPPCNEKGQQKLMKMNQPSLLISAPEPFECSILARSQRHLDRLTAS
ncbi:cytochrome P450 [Coprinopsis sp. MPI-PUGE-AT-0042]|nr:cytochrome P450 [Coprinopsis sp. MPI-PUGE-AT-0042]